MNEAEDALAIAIARNWPLAAAVWWAIGAGLIWLVI